MPRMGRFGERGNHRHRQAHRRAVTGVKRKRRRRWREMLRAQMTRWATGEVRDEGLDRDGGEMVHLT